MSMAFYGPVTCKYDDYPEIVIVMNLFEGPELEALLVFLGDLKYSHYA